MRALNRVFLVVGALAGLSGCNALGYNNSELRLLTGFAAKEMCSCVFVMQQTDDYCREYVRQYIPIGNISVDRSRKQVDAAQGGLWVSSARHDSERFGCVLIETPAP